ncbi:Hypothetical predicted protein, partial [Pelobates cultripes]
MAAIPCFSDVIFPRSRSAAEQRETVIRELRAIQSSTSGLVKSLRVLVKFTDPEKGELSQAQNQ